MKTYDVKRTERPVPLTGDIGGTPWEDAVVVTLNEFNWYESGPKREATARVLYDSEALYLLFHVEDTSISATTTELNGPTFEDSCVEFFATPVNYHPTHYLNFEANCCGTFKLAWQERGWQARGRDRDLVTPSLAADMQVTTSEPGPTRRPTTDDESWWLAAKIPFAILHALTGLPFTPDMGSVWRANFHRTGVETPSQEVTWNPVETHEPKFHSPEYFGRLRFG
ncbi:carbohydrate-binding family 9-like protein [Halegenticoccus tardaugens]|uniref:carbohydrate-binding family 9-like protein n=1 Tax=Halegenticoccus tardaugens TaxID=2071624 RepID=UPI00100B58DA|nr:carbohydrate-binding family 9-like protein [Halegenticoccus tardaugens]